MESIDYPKEVYFHLSYFIDDAKTFLALMLTCKRAHEACKARVEQKKWQTF